MRRVWLRISCRSRQSGFSVIEVLLAATLFGFLVVALTGAIIYGRSGTASAGDRVRALALAEEGCEAVRNIRDAAYANLPGSGTHYLGQSGGVWTIGSTPEAAIGIFSRRIVIGTIDSDRKQAQCIVSWSTGGVNREVTVTTYLSNWAAAIVPPITPGPVMMAYSKTTTTPFYRIWNGSGWGAEGSANAGTGNINYVVLKSSRTRNEAILGTQTSTGAIYVQVWNGTSWGTATQVGTGSTTTRSFDIAYEKNSDRAIVAYASSADFAYRIWNGTSLGLPSTVNAPPTTGAVNWIELRQNPLAASNEIALMMLDANADVYGMMWNGTTWGNMGVAAAWDTTAATATKKAIDVEYEQTSGEAMFMWGDSVITDQYYRTWNGTTLSGATLLDIADENGVAEWVQLAARPSSDQIMLGVQDAQGDLNTRVWSGSGWDAVGQHPEHDITVENIASRNFDIVWETHPSNAGVAWLMWGDGATVSARRWVPVTGWAAPGALAGSNDTSFVRLRADPVSGAVFAGIYNNFSSGGGARDINERRLTGGGSAWSAATQIWAGSTSSDPVFFRIDLAAP